MPLQNRVTPFGQVVAVPHRGLFMGNRGRIHNEERGLKRRHWQLKAWIICVLDFKGRHRQVMAPRSYTELFFLDEATALAAGHRPCVECRRRDALDFKSRWLDANRGLLTGESERMPDIDAVLHDERLSDERRRAKFSAIPDGTFVSDDDPRVALLAWDAHLYPWTAGGYLERRTVRPDRELTVLTPPSTVRVLASGYLPVLHPSVRAQTS